MAKIITDKNDQGLIQVYTGDGKGKTTSALGLILRARGVRKRVAVIYFEKGGEQYSERKMLKKIGVKIFVFGLDRRMDNNKFRFSVTKEDIKEAQNGFKLFKELINSHRYDLIVLDEINWILAKKMINQASLLTILDKKPKNIEVVLTGRNCPASIKKIADLVTEIKLVKHYYYQGINAREGFDY